MDTCRQEGPSLPTLPPCVYTIQYLLRKKVEPPHLSLVQHDPLPPLSKRVEGTIQQLAQEEEEEEEFNMCGKSRRQDGTERGPCVRRQKPCHHHLHLPAHFPSFFLFQIETKTPLKPTVSV